LKNIEILDKKFKLFISNEKIQAVVEQMAEKMNSDLAGKNPLFVCILNGSFIFSADLFTRINIIRSEITFLRVASYSGCHSTGSVKYLIDINENIKGRTVVILEDIVDTGLTINNIHEELRVKNPKQIITATLLLKPGALKENVKLDYVGMEIPNDFIVGYGLDYNGYGRNLTDIYTLINE
jgi:hypoxanthine phosphoribosyltransferase